VAEGNVEIIRAGYATFNRGDWAAVPSFFHPDSVIDTSVAFIGPVSYRGQLGAQRFIESIENEFAEYRCDVVEIVDHGDQVLAVVDLVGRLRVSLRPVTAREIQLWTLKDGLVSELSVFTDRVEAERAMAVRNRS
jgi:ketosteroid isomerase-like protein